MRDLPSGTVTFLFTDIEGSTKLWEQHPEAMRSALARHDALLRDAIQANNGVVFKTVGDAFCAAFHTAPQALAAAVSAQHALVGESWHDGLVLRVRMALHTGSAEERDNDYFGPPLNRVARLLAIGHGEQVLLSSVTRELVVKTLPAGYDVRDMGSHRLKDLQSPEHVWQLIHPDLLADFPPLRSLQAFANNLPIQPTSFIGRDREIQEVKNLLAGKRLLTLTGSGGCGKTRLALQVAADLVEEYADGVWLVELASLTDPALVPQTVASALNVREEPGRPIIQTLCDYLASQRSLLLLDNAEHLVTACASLTETLLLKCPELRVLVTTREPLRLAGEQVYRVPSLLAPDPDHLPRTAQDLAGTISSYDATRLFVERASLQNPDFALTRQNATTVAQLCYRLDGIPLALELAAARVRALTVEDINARLDQRFRLLIGGSRTAVPRQQTLRALIDWSYGLLSEQEKLLLNRLSVFAGGWALEAVEQVCAAESSAGAAIEEWELLDVLTSLVDKSLVIAEIRERNTRYRLLETVRQYARDSLLESGEASEVRSRHRDYFLNLAETAARQLIGPEQKLWLDRLEADHDNLRAALDWSLEENSGQWSVISGQSLGPGTESTRQKNASVLRTQNALGLRGETAAASGEESPSQGSRLKAQGSSEAGLRLAGTLQRFWAMRGYLREGRQRSEAILAMHSGEPTAARALALHGAGNLAYSQGDYSAATAYYQQALAIRQQLGDRPGTAGSLGSLGNVAQFQGDHAKARAMFEQSLAINREVGNRVWEAMNLTCLGSVAQEQGDYIACRSFNEQALALNRELGNRAVEAINLNSLGLAALSLGDSMLAQSLFEQSMAIHRELGDRAGEALNLHNMGNVARERGDHSQVRSYYFQALEIIRPLGMNRLLAALLEGPAYIALDEAQPERAARIFGAIDALREAIGAPKPPNEREEYEHSIAALRTDLGEETFARIWTEGRAMTPEQVAEYALATATE